MIYVGDCIEVMRTLEANSFDSIVTDPPYGIGFMGKAWDGKDIQDRYEKRNAAQSRDPSASVNGAHRSKAAAAGAYDLSMSGMRAFQEFSREWAVEALRVAKPGAHCLAFASPRTFHRLVCGLEEAGWEIRDTLMWVFGSGFPKSRNGDWGGTALKPAWEPIVMARKPIKGTIAQTFVEFGTSGLNIDACRIEGEKPDTSNLRGAIPCRHDERRPRAPRDRAGEESANRRYTESGATSFAATPGPRGGDADGRWPANLMHDGSIEVTTHLKGSARFFYCPKASQADRNDGCDELEDRLFGMSNAAIAAAARGEYYDNGDGGMNAVRSAKNHHPTVKPTELMRWLCRLVTPANGLVLDPFCGSGSTGRAAIAEGMRFAGIEMNHEYARIAEARTAAVQPGLAL